jgi:hypothetical protein
VYRLINLGEKVNCESNSNILAQTCVHLDIIDSCTSFSIKNKCDLEFDGKIVLAENKIRIWQTNFETNTQGLP